MAVRYRLGRLQVCSADHQCLAVLLDFALDLSESIDEQVHYSQSLTSETYANSRCDLIVSALRQLEIPSSKLPGPSCHRFFDRHMYILSSRGAWHGSNFRKRLQDLPNMFARDHAISLQHHNVSLVDLDHGFEEVPVSFFAGNELHRFSLRGT